MKDGRGGQRERGTKGKRKGEKRIKGDAKRQRKQTMDEREKKRKQGKAEFELPLSGSETDT